MKYLSTEQLRESLEKAATINEKYYSVLLTLAKTGCRASELVSITPNDINKDEKQIIVRGKGNKIRNVDVPADLLIQLALYIKNKKIKANKPIFDLSIQRITQITKRFTTLSAHAFRHTYAIHLLRTTKNIRYVQTQLGHSSLATTQIYLRFMDYKKEKQKLGEMYS